jgi:amino acid adenylation domain-containing protein/thioester reductase-like protein
MQDGRSLIHKSFIQRSFIKQFEAMVSANGEAVAVLSDGTKELSYRELQARARLVGSHLAQLGIGRDDIVGICLKKSADYIVALLGTWYAGAAFLPLDSALPLTRLRFIIGEAGVKAAFLANEGDTRLSGLNLIELTLGAIFSESSPPSNKYFSQSDLSDTDDALAYVIYTSGSTGQPKGVMIDHRGIVNLLEAQIETFQLERGKRALFYLSTAFDASISDIGTCLLSGATLCIENADRLVPGKPFQELIAERRITHMDIPPSLLRILSWQEMPDCLETIIIGGEACEPAVVRQWSSRFRVVVVYGPTEATVCTSMCLCEHSTWDRPLIGQPLPGITYSILDENRISTPIGTAGELYIGGLSLARGYMKRPELDAYKFIQVNGQPLYRTGDRVIRDDDGEIRFIGRADRQFKFRGLLIEPEELEAKLLNYPGVQRVAVLKRRISESLPREAVVAFIENKDGEIVSGPAVKAYLRQLVPLWMVPQYVQIVEKMPLTVTGKVDLASLQKMPFFDLGVLSSKTRRDSKEFREGGIETGATPSLKKEIISDVFSTICCELLAVTDIDLDDNFFDLGADSFNVLELTVAAEAHGIKISPNLIIERPTINKLVEFLTNNQAPSESRLIERGGMLCSEIRSEVARLSENCSELFASRAEATLASKVNSHSITAAAPGSGLSVVNSLPKSVFLTGSTGFLGARILHEFLRNSADKIFCLVRASNIEEAHQRIEDAMLRQGLTISRSESVRIMPICGDLEDKQFGLSDDAFLALANAVDTIFHCAAQVNMLSPYEQLRKSNLDSLLEIVKLMSLGLSKTLHYASTLSVFVATDRNSGIAKETDELNDTSVVYGGYAQTKWAAEIFLRSLPRSIGQIYYYRFGLLTGDQRSGISAKSDFLSLFFRGITEFGYVPADSLRLEIDITPIDFAAAAMIAIARNLEATARYSTFHIANSESLSLEQLISYLRARGYLIDEIPVEDIWFNLHECKDRAMYPIMAAAVLALCRNLGDGADFEKFRTLDLFQATGIKFETSNTDLALSNSGVSCPKPTRELIGKYLDVIFTST